MELSEKNVSLYWIGVFWQLNWLPWPTPVNCIKQSHKQWIKRMLAQFVIALKTCIIIYDHRYLFTALLRIFVFQYCQGKRNLDWLTVYSTVIELTWDEPTDTTVIENYVVQKTAIGDNAGCPTTGTETSYVSPPVSNSWYFLKLPQSGLCVFNKSASVKI